MRNSRIIPALAFVAVSVASAGDKVGVPTDWTSLGSVNLEASGFVEFEVDFSEPDAVGFEVGFDYAEPVRDDSWASDLQIVAVTPSRDTFTVGGQTNLPHADEAWSFQGKISNGGGHYGDDGDDVFLPWLHAPLADGRWTFRFINDWATDPNGNDYANIRLRFYVLAPPTCPEDVDGDDEVGFSDVLRIIASWGPCPDCPEDIDRDGAAGFGDVLRVLARWGPCPPPPP